VRADLLTLAAFLLAAGASAQKTVSFPTSDGGVIFADVYGSGDRAVVLAHGGQFNKESWSEQARTLASAGFRVLAIDFRGYGPSHGPGDRDPLGAPLHLDVLAAVRFLHQGGAKSVSIVGGSMGGSAAGDASIAAAPGEIDRIVFLGSAPNDPADRLKSASLFIVARNDANDDGPRLPGIEAQYRRAPEPKKLVVLEGTAHAQYLFRTKDAQRVMGEILQFLSPIQLTATSSAVAGKPPSAVPDETVVLTLDDAVKSQIQIVAPLLEQLGFKATFFISHAWMDDKEHFLSWEDVADLHRRGFEIGNHTWTHAAFDKPEQAAKLEQELQMVDDALAHVGVPKPISFAWPGDNFGPEAIAVLKAHGIELARRGMQPEVPYGEVQVGPLLDVSRNHPLLIPTTGDAYPDWTLEHFKNVVSGARDGKVVVLQFHGVPDTVHPWVNTPPEMFRQYMLYLKQNGYQVIALRDLMPYFNWSRLPEDPMLTQRVATSRKK